MIQTNRPKAHEDIDTIFLELLPENGMAVREPQIDLCHTMLDAMADGKIALCDAGVGIGKTFAYLVAATIFRKYDKDNVLPDLISTASIALQNAILKEYIPFLSNVLFQAGMIEKPLRAVIRKGKGRYVCDKRLTSRIDTANLDRKNPAAKKALLSLNQHLDMDGVEHLSDYDKKQVCVPDTCDCRHSACRYKQFVQESKTPEYPFQICNHNFLAADSMHRRDGLPPLLPDYRAIVIDEAHRLPEAARRLQGKQPIKETMWDLPVPMILTSGSLAVGSDFSRFRDESKLKNIKRPIMESVSLSPFDYEKNCLLYFPESVTHPHGSDAYYAETAETIVGLIEITNGHALILFNAYSDMAALCERLRQRNLTVPFFIMKRNHPTIIKAFRESGNGVLFATGSVWEGMDFPGDIVSSLIIVRLPFAVPDQRSNSKKQRYPSLKAFIRAVAVPDMQIRLRQGFGRAIRTETDTCVITILDERALIGRRYHQAVLNALPPMPVTESLRAVEAFIREVKPAGFFAKEVPK